MIRTLLIPAELLFRSSPRRWAAVAVALTAVGVAVGWVAVAAVCPENCSHP